MAEVKTVLNLKFRGIDDWNRPVFKVEGMNLYYGSVNYLINYNEKDEAITHFKEHPEELEYFGRSFNCEPHGGNPFKVELVILG